MSSNFGEIVKKLIPVFGEKPARGLPKTPPAWRLDLATLTLGENIKLSCQAPNQAARLRRLSVGWGGDSAIPRFLNSEMVSKK